MLGGNKVDIIESVFTNSSGECYDGGVVRIESFAKVTINSTNFTNIHSDTYDGVRSTIPPPSLIQLWSVDQKYFNRQYHTIGLHDLTL